MIKHTKPPKERKKSVPKMELFFKACKSLELFTSGQY